MTEFRLNMNPERAKSRYFHKNRTQPFIITFFMAVLAFKKMFKVIRLKLGQKRVIIPHRRASTFLSAVKRSKHTIGQAMRGAPIITSASTSSEAAVAAAAELAAQMVMTNKVKDALPSKSLSSKAARYQKAEALNKQVSKTLDGYYNRLRNNLRQPTLSDKLDQAVKLQQLQLENSGAPHHRQENAGHRATTAGGGKRPLTAKDNRGSGAIDGVPMMASTGNALQDWNNATQHTSAAAQQAAQQAAQAASLAAATLDIGEYLEGTPLYYGATLALQARHGGYLSYSSGEIKAAAHKVTSHSRFIVKKSDDLTDIGAVKFGDALWLQTVNTGTTHFATSVLGAVYGSLVDKKREIQPGLVSCKRSAMFKAQQYGRWIVLHRDDPVNTLGKQVGHLDKVILEQEWCFLASSSPSSSSMFRICENSDDALLRKIDLFRPGDECVWRLHLVALPSDDGDDEKQRQQRLQEAKDQIDASEALRLKKAAGLLSSLAATLPAHLRDDTYLQEKMRHKATAQSEQDHLRQRYREIDQRSFRAPQGSAAFLQQVYGMNSPIAKFRQQAQLINDQQYATSPTRHPPNNTNYISSNANNSIVTSEMQATFLTTGLTIYSHNAANSSGVATGNGMGMHEESARLETQYWDAAQKLLVSTQTWTQLPQVMAEFMDKDRARKQQAARILQAFVRRALDRRFNFVRSFRRVDKVARSKLETKLMLRRKLLLDAGASEATINAHNHLATTTIVESEALAAAAAATTSAIENISGGAHLAVWQAVNRFKEAGIEHRLRRGSAGATTSSSVAQLAQQIAQTVSQEEESGGAAKNDDGAVGPQRRASTAVSSDNNNNNSNNNNANGNDKRASSAGPRRPQSAQDRRPTSAQAQRDTSSNHVNSNANRNKPPLNRRNSQQLASNGNSNSNDGKSGIRKEVAIYAAQYEAFMRHQHLEHLQRRASFAAFLNADNAMYFEQLQQQLIDQEMQRQQQLLLQHQQQQGHHHSRPPLSRQRTLAEIDGQTHPAPTASWHPTDEGHPHNHVHRTHVITPQQLLHSPQRPQTAPSKYSLAATRPRDENSATGDGDAAFHATTRTLSTAADAQASLRVQTETEEIKAALIQTPQRLHGLPPDVFEDIKGPTSVRTGVKFLRAMSHQERKHLRGVPAVATQSTPDLFDDLRVRRRHRSRPHSHHHHRSSGQLDVGEHYHSDRYVDDAVQRDMSPHRQRPHSSNAALRRR